jgi:hypothetical protein
MLAPERSADFWPAGDHVQRVTQRTRSLPQKWLVPGAFNGGFTSRVPIQYFNANISVLARKLDELATIRDQVLDQQKTRSA